MESTQFFKDEFIRRKEKNDHYSIRAFARDLGVSHALVSQIFSGKRQVTVKQALKFASVLHLSDRETQKLVLSCQGSSQSKLPENRFSNLQLEFDKLVGRWFHVALLELTYLKNFKSDPLWIAKTLGVSTVEVRDAIESLKALGLLGEKKGKLFKTKDMISFTGSRSLSAVRAYYQKILEKAGESLKDSSDDAYQSRYIGGGTLAVRRDQVPLARKRLREMQDEFIKEFAVKDADQVYQINFNFFSLTQEIK